MKTILGIAILAVLGAPMVRAQASQNSTTKATPGSGTKAAPAAASATKTGTNPTDESARADLYYYFAMGHLNEQQYELTGRSEQAAESIDFYKKALALQPGSPVIMERLAEIYAKSQRVRDAVAQGRHKALILLGHEVSEEPGMERCAKELRELFPRVRVDHIEAGQPLWNPEHGPVTK